VPCAANLVGTSAELIIGDMISVEELLYGMMLPSGNDAA
jgi:D-alanyl-D-alanine carboxypeptidase